MTTGDFNRDGIPDLAVANADGHSLSMLIGRGDGQFTRSDLSIGMHRGPRGLTVERSQRRRPARSCESANDSASLAIFFGNGAGAFPTRADSLGGAAHPQGVATGDFNRDGRRDIAVAARRIARAGGAGPRQRISSLPVVIPGASALNVVAVADLNGDGWLDVAAASTSAGRGRDSISAGVRVITFQRLYAVEADPRGLAIADVTSDGVADVITAEPAPPSRVSVLPGYRAHPGAFLPRLTFATGQGGRAVTVADFNVDGRLDSGHRQPGPVVRVGAVECHGTAPRRLHVRPLDAALRASRSSPAFPKVWVRLTSIATAGWISCSGLPTPTTWLSC